MLPSVYSKRACLALIITVGVLWLWVQFCNGAIGTKGWKKKTFECFRKRFRENQEWLKKLIKAEGMTA